MSDIVDLKAARTARAEATVNAELERLAGPMTTEDKLASIAAAVSNLSLAFLEINRSLTRIAANQGLASSLSTICRGWSRSRRC